MGKIDELLTRNGNELERILNVLSESALGDLQILLQNIDSEIDALTELRGEVNERTEHVLKAIDLNHRLFNEPETSNAMPR